MKEIKVNVGYTILESTKVNDTEIVLGFNPLKAARYVAWINPCNCGFINGNYHNDIFLAIQDFRVRISKEINLAKVGQQR